MRRIVPLRRLRDPARIDTNTVPELFEVPVEMQDADPGLLRGGGDRQVGEGKAMRVVGAVDFQRTRMSHSRNLSGFRRSSTRASIALKDSFWAYAVSTRSSGMNSSRYRGPPGCGLRQVPCEPM